MSLTGAVSFRASAKCIAMFYLCAPGRGHKMFPIAARRAPPACLLKGSDAATLVAASGNAAAKSSCTSNGLRVSRSFRRVWLFFGCGLRARKAARLLVVPPGDIWNCIICRRAAGPQHTHIGNLYFWINLILLKLVCMLMWVGVGHEWDLCLLIRRRKFNGFSVSALRAFPNNRNNLIFLRFSLF